MCWDSRTRSQSLLNFPRTEYSSLVYGFQVITINQRKTQLLQQLDLEKLLFQLSGRKNFTSLIIICAWKIYGMSSMILYFMYEKLNKKRVCIKKFTFFLFHVWRQGFVCGENDFFIRNVLPKAVILFSKN